MRHYQDSTLTPEMQEEKLGVEIEHRWTPLKQASDRLADSYLRLEYYDRADRVRDCGTALWFALTEDGPKLHRANFCRARLCPMCNDRRALKIYGQASQIMDWLDTHHAPRYVFLTLTLRNVDSPDLPAGIDAILAGWRRLTYRTNCAWTAAVLGSMRTLEVTYNGNTGTWHPHLHCILAVPPDYFKGRSDHGRSSLYITQRRWAEMWAAAAGVDYTPVVDVRTVKVDTRSSIINELAGKDKRSRIDGRDVLRLMAADGGRAAARYAAKGLGDILDGSSVEDTDTRVAVLDSALYRRRLVGWTGLFRSARQELALEDAEEGDLVHVEAEQLRADVAEAVICYRWRAGAYQRT